jgi:hypothetical protein
MMSNAWNIGGNTA